MFQEFIEILILSAIQGISEFLPISSSAHLILVSNLYDLKTGSLLIDISLHLGSLFAIIFYFRKDLFDLKNNNKYVWQKDHKENKTGTKDRHQPVKIKKDTKQKKYETWK